MFLQQDREEDLRFCMLFLSSFTWSSSIFCWPGFLRCGFLCFLQHALYLASASASSSLLDIPSLSHTSSYRPYLSHRIVANQYWNVNTSLMSKVYPLHITAKILSDIKNEVKSWSNLDVEIWQKGLWDQFKSASKFVWELLRTDIRGISNGTLYRQCRTIFLWTFSIGHLSKLVVRKSSTNDYGFLKTVQ